MINDPIKIKPSFLISKHNRVGSDLIMNCTGLLRTIVACIAPHHIKKLVYDKHGKSTSLRWCVTHLDNCVPMLELSSECRNLLKFNRCQKACNIEIINSDHQEYAKYRYGEHSVFACKVCKISQFRYCPCPFTVKEACISSIEFNGVSYGGVLGKWPIMEEISEAKI